MAFYSGELEGWRQRILSFLTYTQNTTCQQSTAALPRNLKRLMDAHAWTVGRLSKASGVNRSTIRNVLKAGKAHNHTLDVILRLAEALGVGLNALVEEREP